MDFTHGPSLSFLQVDRNRYGEGVAFVILYSFTLKVKVMCEVPVDGILSSYYSTRSLLMHCAYSLSSKADFYDHFTSACEKFCLYVLCLNFSLVIKPE